jgi:uncharacterized protein
VIEIPSERLSRDILGAVIEEYILREGTDYGVQETSLESKIKQVHRQIVQGDVLITFDPVTENCTLLTRNQFNRYSKDLQTNERSDL